MNFIESIIFLILYVGFFAGIPLMWYAKQVSENKSGTVREPARFFRVHSDKTFEEAHRDAVERVKNNATGTE